MYIYIYQAENQYGQVCAGLTDNMATRGRSRCVQTAMVTTSHLCACASPPLDPDTPHHQLTMHLVTEQALFTNPVTT